MSKRVVFVGALLALAYSVAAAQGWKPERPVEIAVPTTPGGSVDLTARLLQKIMQDTGLVKVPVSVVNKPGGGGAVSLVYLNQHPGDGRASTPL